MEHCGLVAGVKGDQIIRVRGDFDHPLTRGYTCPKGRATGQLHHHEDAITRPAGDVSAVGGIKPGHFFSARYSNRIWVGVRR